MVKFVSWYVSSISWSVSWYISYRWSGPIYSPKLLSPLSTKWCLLEWKHTIKFYSYIFLQTGINVGTQYSLRSYHLCQKTASWVLSGQKAAFCSSKGKDHFAVKHQRVCNEGKLAQTDRQTTTSRKCLLYLVISCNVGSWSSLVVFSEMSHISKHLWIDWFCCFVPICMCLFY